MKKNGKTKSKPANYIDLTGQRFGALTVIREEGRRKSSGEVLWLCECDCGGNSIVPTSNLKRGNTKSCGCRKAIDIQRFEERYLQTFEERHGDSFEYIDGYKTGDHCPIEIKCKECGRTFTRDKANTYKDFSCPHCKRDKREAERLAEKERQKARMKAIVCKECGKLIFIPYSSQKQMCDICKTMKAKEKRKINKRLREAKAKKNGKVDYSITLTRLIERDNHICQLCGREVDETDYTYINDNFIAGNNYPSIDHIVPLSKGGKHQWDNVQLAHRICNSIKQDKENI